MRFEALRWGSWLALAGCAVLLLWGAASAPLVDPDEARFARTSVEMQRAGDPVVPRFEGEPRLVKPPMLHWLQMALFGVFGAGEGVARAPAIGATLISLLLVGWIGRHHFGPEGGLWTLLFLGTMPIVVAIGRSGTLDALLAVHVLAVIAIDLAAPPGRPRGLAVAVGALLGLAFLVKGPVGVILPLLAIAAGRTAAGRRILPSGGAFGTALAAWSVVVLPWSLAFLRRVGPEEVLRTLRTETVDRYVQGTAHVQPTWYYLPVLLVAGFPWMVPATIAAVRAVVRRRDPASPVARYLAAGFLAGVAFFSLGESKIASYVLPLFPLVALLATWELGRQLAEPRRAVVGPLTMSIAQGAAAVGLAYFGVPFDGGRHAGVAWAGVAILGVAAVGMLVGVLRRAPRQAFGWAVGSSWLFLAVLVYQVVPEVAESRSTRALVRQVPQLAGHEPPVTVAIRIPSLTFYLDRIPERVPVDRLAKRLDAPDSPLLIVADEDYWHLPHALLEGMRVVATSGKYRVLHEVGAPDGPSPGPLDPIPSRR